MDNMKQFEGNPFAGILSSLGQRQQPQPQQAPQSQMPQRPMPQNGGMEDDDNQLMKGKGAGTTPLLMGAIQSLQKYVTTSTDPDEIRMARSIITLISKLITRDQGKMSERLNQDMEMSQVNNA